MRITLKLNNYTVPDFLRVAANFGCDKYAYVVTANTDHVIRLCEDASFRELYDAAGFALLDSRFLAIVIRVLKRVRLASCPGSDVTEQLLASVVSADDKLVMIGGTQAQARTLADNYGLRQLKHFNPPMKFIEDSRAVENCLQFIEQESPFRFCILAVGCPQQELLGRELLRRDRARGLALCVGASINFLTGVERRAPLWMRKVGFEWVYRLCNDPVRLARRYLVRGPRILLLLWRIRFVPRLRGASSMAQMTAAAPSGVHSQALPPP